MSLSISVYVEAAHELREAVVWYNQGGRGRGRRVKDTYEAALERILEWPGSGVRDFDHELEVEVRKVKIAQSDYWVIYFVTDEVLFVVAVAHERREPGYWKDRVPAG